MSNQQRFRSGLAWLILALLLPATGLARAEPATPTTIEDQADDPAPARRLDRFGREAALDLTIDSDQAPDGTSTTRVVIDTRAAFDNKQDRLRPDYARFLSRVGIMLQRHRGTVVKVTGFARHAKADYNPVLLGRRVRAIQVFLAENGAPIDQVKAQVRGVDDYDGPAGAADRAATGTIIILGFSHG
jgi:outer membrane protein OmpA-like peptidoglycan-associated protein